MTHSLFRIKALFIVSLVRIPRPPADLFLPTIFQLIGVVSLCFPGVPQKSFSLFDQFSCECVVEEEQFA